MLRVKPFQGLRPVDDLVSLVASVPFDAVDTKEAAALVADNPYSMLHVDRAEIDLPEETDPSSEAVAEQARQTFLTFRQHEILVPENQPCVYLYQQRKGEQVQTGIGLTCHIEDYERGIIRTSGETPPVAGEEDRARIIDAIGAHTTPVVLTYPDTPDLDALVAEVLKMPSLFDFTSPDGVVHTVWRLPGLALAEFFVKAFEQVPFADVVGGHLLAASAVRVGRERREKNLNHTGKEPYNWLLCVLFPAGQLRGIEPQRCSGLFVHTLG